MENENFKYYAFISYSHKDKKIARKLQRWLQSYYLPSKIIEAHPDLPKKLSPIFIDESDLVARRGSLSESLKVYLNESNFLIIICSPNSAKSEYVNDEVDYFINTLNRGNRVIPLIVDGLPHAKDTSIECFPPALLALPRELEPLGIDLRTFKKRGAFLRVMAALLKLEIDYFISGADEERKRRAKIFASFAAVLLLAAGMIIRNYINFFRVMQDADAQYNLGEMYYYGRGVSKDYEEAIKWYEKAAANGHFEAKNNINHRYHDLALKYYNSRGLETDEVKPDFSRAAELFGKAADNGNSDSQYYLGYMHQIGLAVVKDYAKALEWYEISANNGNIKAQYHLGQAYWEGSITERNYDKAVLWYKKAADNGLLQAQKKLASIYYKGSEVKQDYLEAIKWFEKAADKKDAESQYTLGFMFENGLGVKPNYEKATEWFELAADNGSIESHTHLDYLYQKVNGNANVQYRIGYIYENGLGVKQNYSKAAEWYEKSANNGNTKAQYKLAVMYENGIGVEQDYVKATKWYNQAAANSE